MSDLVGTQVVGFLTHMLMLLADRQPSFVVMFSAAIDDAVDVVTRPIDEALPRTDDDVGCDFSFFRHKSSFFFKTTSSATSTLPQRLGNS